MNERSIDSLRAHHYKNVFSAWACACVYVTLLGRVTRVLSPPPPPLVGLLTRHTIVVMNTYDGPMVDDDDFSFHSYNTVS